MNVEVCVCAQLFSEDDDSVELVQMTLNEQCEIERMKKKLEIERMNKSKSTRAEIKKQTHRIYSPLLLCF